MATDRSRQQSGEAPQGGAPSQQGGTRTGQQSDWDRERGSTSQASTLPTRRGTYEPGYYGGRAGTGQFALMRRISDEMDRMFESFGMGGLPSRDFGLPSRDFFGGSAFGDPGMKTLWSPHIELSEREGKLLIQADLPGIAKDDVNVQIEQDAVIIEGERKQERTRDERGYYHSERSYGSFHRVIPLPEGVDAEQAKATFRDGVLQIELPAPQPRQRGRRLTIEDRSTGSEPRSPGGTRGQQQG